MSGPVNVATVLDYAWFAQATPPLPGLKFPRLLLPKVKGPRRKEPIAPARPVEYRRRNARAKDRHAEDASTKP